MKSAITLHDLSFAWPDGTVVLDSVNGSFPTGRTGLVGRNGAGKSTLLKLMAGVLTPASGRIDCGSEVGYLPQNLTLSRTTTVAQLLGVEHILDALRAIEGGDVAQAHFDTVGNDWDIESRAIEALDSIGFPAEVLHRRVPQLSGGEAMLIAVTGLRLRRSGVTLLDEPTNNLDRPTRARLREMVQEWSGSLVIVSHDLELLEVMDQTTELHAGTLDTFGGPYSAWREHREQAQAAAVHAAQSAQQLLKTEKRQRQEAESKLARRERTAKRRSGTAGSRRSSPATGPARPRYPQGTCGALWTRRSPRRRLPSTPQMPGSARSSTSASSCRTLMFREGAASPSCPMASTTMSFKAPNGSRLSAQTGRGNRACCSVFSSARLWNPGGRGERC